MCKSFALKSSHSALKTVHRSKKIVSLCFRVKPSSLITLCQVIVSSRKLCRSFYSNKIPLLQQIAQVIEPQNYASHHTKKVGRSNQHWKIRLCKNCTKLQIRSHCSKEISVKLCRRHLIPLFWESIKIVSLCFSGIQINNQKLYPSVLGINQKLYPSVLGF